MDIQGQQEKFRGRADGNADGWENTMQYARPSSLKDAISLLAEAKGNAFVLAGGSDLLVRMKGGFIEPGLVVDIKAIDGLGEIRETAEGFAIGAAVPCAVMGETTALKKAWPGVVEAANLIGSKQVQGRCTITGNLCNASPAADSVPALVAAGARAVIAGPAGKRTVAVEEVPTGPGKTSLAKGEIIEAILLDKRAPRSGDAYLRFIPRTEMDIAVVSAGVNLTLDDQGVVTSARIALGAAAPTVLLVAQAADALVGTKADTDALEKLAAACSSACRPIDDKRGTVEFRKKVAGVLAKRAATIAYQRAGGK
jgi:aerobic carbon-monoxide dehydrogenase medium subunit